MEIQLWRELLDPYQLAVDELTVKFHHIIEEHRNQGLYSPIESVDGRVKSIVSILDKMQRKNVSMNDICLLYTSPSPRDRTRSRMPSSA